MARSKDFFKDIKGDYEHKNNKWPPFWIVSFSDMMTLLLTFFIFFFSVTTLKELPKILQHFKRESSVIVPIDESEFPVPEKTALIEKKFLRRDEEVIEKFKKYLRTADLEKDVELKADAGEVTITIKNPILFDLGKSELKPRALPILNNLTDLFKNNENYIRVEGHTDNLPIHTDKFPSNWELSASRAISVIKYFIEEKTMSPSRFEALGYGEFRPAETNATDEGRAKNRRVEIKIIQTKK
jgi:chemotaxis protein MotB